MYNVGIYKIVFFDKNFRKSEKMKVKINMVIYNFDVFFRFEIILKLGILKVIDLLRLY